MSTSVFRRFLFGFSGGLGIYFADLMDLVVQ